MQLLVINLFIVVLFLSSNVYADNFCEGRTTAAYHSPLCDWYVVKDPHRIENVHIAHKPAYHTYSRWLVNNKQYIFAYRDIDYNPNDMELDIYPETKKKHVPVGSIDISGLVQNVFTARLTSKQFDDIVIRADDGQLQYMTVVKMIKGRARKVFDYGASEIEVKNGSKPMIEARSRKANIVQQFAWSLKINKFVKIREFKWY